MTSKMNPQWKEKWVEALRSGEYKQATGKLKSHDYGYCCLGVLQHLVDPSYFEKLPGANYLPDETCEITGVSYSGKIATDLILSALNDKGVTFEAIAELIENYL